MREKPAVDAVAEPLRLTDRAFQNGVAASLVTDLLEIRVKSPDGAIVKAPGEFVEPVHLQVACERIWKSLKPGEKVITYKMLAASGDVDAALQEFYERAIASALAAAPGLKEATLRQFFERDLITAAGTRGTVYRGGTETCGIPNEAIDALDKEHIVRPEFRGGAQWYELTHDRLIEPIRKSGQSWLNKGKRQGLEDRAKAWSDGGRGSAGLLTEAELQDYRKWLESPEALSLGHTRTVDEFLEASRKALDAEDTILRLAWDRFRSYDLGAVRSQLRYRTLRYVILLLAAAVLGAAFAYVEFSHYNHLWLPSLHIAIVAAAVAIPVIQALASVRRDENKWRMLRVAAESVKREIYRYRTRVGIYGETESRNASRSAKLATALESISSTLAPSETILSVASSASPGDLNALTGMEYLASRVQAQIQYFTSKIRLVNQRQLTLQMAAFTFAAAGVFFAALSLDLWVVGSFIIYLALLALQEMQPVRIRPGPFESEPHRPLQSSRLVGSAQLAGEGGSAQPGIFGGIRGIYAGRRIDRLDRAHAAKNLRTAPTRQVCLRCRGIIRSIGVTRESQQAV